VYVDELRIANESDVPPPFDNSTDEDIFLNFVFEPLGVNNRKYAPLLSSDVTDTFSRRRRC
jgi:hypothetical protein